MASKKSNPYGAIISVYPASDSSTSGAPSPVSPRTPLLSRFDDNVQLTEQERQEYERGLLTWERAADWRFWIRREWIPFYAIAAVLLTMVSTVAIYHREIITRLMPLVERVRGVPYGWAVPIAAITIFSFPPLFGSEVVMILSGVVWGVKGGCAIAAGGTILGEMACFTMFRTCCKRRAARFSRQSLNYACLSRVVDRGGLFGAWIVRLSAIPTHVSTVIFAVCGLEYLQFLTALVLALPKQFIAVYVGVMVRSSHGREDIMISNIVLGASFIITLLALWYVHHQMLRVRKRVFLDMRDDLLRRGINEPLPPSDDEDDDDSDYFVWSSDGFRQRRLS